MLRIVLAAAAALIASRGVAAQSPDRFLTDRKSPVELALTDEADSFTFAIFGDRTGGPPEGVLVLADAVRDTNILGPDLVMTVGDLVQGYNDTPAWLAQAMEFRGIMDGLRMPWYPVAGNHDVYWRGPDRPPLEHEGNYETHFGPLWYAFEHKDCWFVALFSDETNPQTGEKNFTKPENHPMSPAQFGWLDGVLGKTKGARHVFVFLHHPRWIGGQYGNSWEPIHERLVAAGNVTAVFAGHIHRMTYTERDGIEYFALATTGGHQSGLVPAAGFLHHYDLVTVRDSGIHVATLPVGEVIDPRELSEDVVRDATRLAREFTPSIQTDAVDRRIKLDADFGCDARVQVTMRNPTGFPVEFEALLAGRDPRWSITPDHVHGRIESEEERTFTLTLTRDAEGQDGAFDFPALEVRADLLARGARVAIPAQTHELPIDAVLTAPKTPDVEHTLLVTGSAEAVAVPASSVEVPDGPFTLEAWFQARSFADRVGLVTKTEASEFGIFVSKGQPHFSVHVDGAYAALTATDVVATGDWHHVAGVFDGEEIRLYVDGQLAGRRPASGRRTTNRLPLMIGADVDGQGRATSPFDGFVDEIRISTGARYAGDRFVPERRHAGDAATLLLFHCDSRRSPWLFDDSPRAAHVRRPTGARVVPATR
ncbi:MAG: hypothetical protein RL562_2764 [Planctomycetota bacterium]